MEDRLIYLESDEEITSVIDKISKAGVSEVALVIPRGGNLAQSIVNLKILKKRASDLGKDVSLVTTDKISRNLASQVGISVYSRVEEVGRKVVPPVPMTPAKPELSNAEIIRSDVPAPEPAKPAEELPELPGIKIHRYYDERQKNEPDSPTARQDKAEKSLTPKPTEEILQKKAEIIEASKIEVMPDIVKKEEEKPVPGEVIELPEPGVSESESPHSSLSLRAHPSESKTKVQKSGEAIDSSGDRLQTPDDNDFKHKKMSVGEAIKVSRESSIVDRQSRTENSESINLPAGRQGHKLQMVNEKKPKLPGRRFKPMKRRRALLVMIAAVLIIILAFGYLILPQAKATVVFKAENFDQTSEVTLDIAQKEVDTDKIIIPATSNNVQKEISDKFSATGQKNIGTKAGGELTFYNASELTPQKITSGSQMTANGKNFVTDGDITIPAVTTVSVIPPVFSPGTVKGKVVAVDVGEDSNLPVNTKFLFSGFSGSKQNNVYGQNAAALSGGSTKNVKVIQQSDINTAQDAIKARLSAEARDEVLKKVPANEKYIEGTIVETQSDLKPSVPVATQADDFTFSGKISTTILSFNENTLRDLLISKYEAKLDSNRVLVQKDKIALEYAIKTPDIAAGKTVYSVKMSGKISSKVDTEKLKEQLSGKSLEEGRKILSALDLANKVDIKMSPNLSFYKTLPLFKNSIKIETVYQAE